MRGLGVRRRGDDHLGYDLVRLQVVLALGFRLWNNVELFQRKLPFPLWPFEPDLRCVRDEHRRDSRGADEFRWAIIGEDRVIPVVTLYDQFFAGFVFGQKTESVTKIPAAWPLTEVPAESRHISNLRASRFDQRLGQRRIILLHVRIIS